MSEFIHVPGKSYWIQAFGGDDRKYEQASQFGTTPKNGYNPIKLWFDLDESDGSPSSSVS